MKIELENGNTIETIDSQNTSRSRRAKLWELLNDQYVRKLTEEEEKVVESFMVDIKEPEAFKREYTCIWCSSSEESK